MHATRTRWAVLTAAALLFPTLVDEAAAQVARAPAARPAAAEQAVRGAVEQLIAAFNAGKAAEVAKLVVPLAEFEDESGRVHSGREAIAELAGSFAQRFPGAKMEAEIESVRVVAPQVAIVHLIRTTTTADGADQAHTRGELTLVDHEGKWLVAALRETPAEDELGPRARLESLAWLVGDWVDEGRDAMIELACRWSEDGNYLLIDHTTKSQGQVALKSQQRIGWDPLKRQIHSWTFDSDGGFGEGQWTRDGKAWRVQSSAVLPDGTVGSAQFTVEPVSEDRFVMKASHRVAGDVVEADREVTVVRKPSASRAAR